MKKHLPLVFIPLAIAWIACTLNVQERLNSARSANIQSADVVKVVK